MFLRNVRLMALIALLAGMATPVAAQQMAAIRGTVTGTGGDKQPLAGVTVALKGTSILTTTNGNGKFVFLRVPAGSQTLVFRWLGYAPVERTVTVAGDQVVDVTLEPKAVALADLTVTAASKEPERIVQAPAAVSTIEPRVLQSTGATGQAPMALAQSPGVDMAQSGVNDFNINARGFNSSLNRRVLTLLDGRDLAIAFLGSQEWNSLPVSTEDLRGMELVRGPGSALYGPNAFAGVLNMSSLSPREALGGRISASGGGMSSKKIDGRFSSLVAGGKYGVRFTAGYSSNDTWTRSRTSIDSVGAGGAFSLALRNEYGKQYQDATRGTGKDSIIKATSPEVRALVGQTCGGTTEICSGSTRRPKGDRDPITALYGSARVDRYFGASALTIEGGASEVKNEVLVTGIGRVQVAHGRKPYLRAAFNSDHLNVFGYMNWRESVDSQYSLASGAGLLESSRISHVEAQTNQMLLNGDLRGIVGASYRTYQVNTHGTLMRPEDDDRNDNVKSIYGQGEYRLADKFRLVGAARWDEGTLFKGQFSPKVALVYTPNESHGFRFTLNKAFQTPNYSEFFLRAAAGAPANFTALEAGMRASALGPALAGVPQGQLFTNSAAVPVFARGNASLDVEKTTGYEVGYKGALSERVYVTLDLYQNNIKDFVTDLLPGVNPTQFPYWTPPAAVPAQFHAQLVGAIKGALGASPATATAGAGLSRTEDGRTAVVVSYTNEGEVKQKGLDLGLGVQLAKEFRMDGSFSWFDFTVKSQNARDQLLPNTPDRKATMTLSYLGANNGVSASLSGRFVASYDWAAGVFVGRVPSIQTINASIGLETGEGYRLFATGNNILNQQRYQLFGGSVIGRRILVGVTTMF